MVQWNMRFENAQRIATEPRRAQETPEQFQMRQRAAYEQLRQLQMSKPTPSAPKQDGGLSLGSIISGGPIGGIYSMLNQALAGANARSQRR